MPDRARGPAPTSRFGHGCDICMDHSRRRSLPCEDPQAPATPRHGPGGLIRSDDDEVELMRARRLKAAAAIAAVGALTLAACGNGDGNGADPGEDPADGTDDPAAALPVVI